MHFSEIIDAPTYLVGYCAVCLNTNSFSTHQGLSRYMADVYIFQQLQG